MVTPEQLLDELGTWMTAIGTLQPPSRRESRTLRRFEADVRCLAYVAEQLHSHDSYRLSSSRSGTTGDGSAGSEV